MFRKWRCRRKLAIIGLFSFEADIGFEQISRKGNSTRKDWRRLSTCWNKTTRKLLNLTRLSDAAQVQQTTFQTSLRSENCSLEIEFKNFYCQSKPNQRNDEMLEVKCLMEVENFIKQGKLFTQFALLERKEFDEKKVLSLVRLLKDYDVRQTSPSTTLLCIRCKRINDCF